MKKVLGILLIAGIVAGVYFASKAQANSSLIQVNVRTLPFVGR